MQILVLICTVGASPQVGDFPTVLRHLGNMIRNSPVITWSGYLLTWTEFDNPMPIINLL